GSGKSTVANLLVNCGAQLVDTDAIARAITQAGGAAMPTLAAAFGPSALTPDGALDRAHMRALAFSDAEARLRLEAILHPLIGREALRQAAAVTVDVVVFDVPLLTASSHWRQRVARVLVVDCSVDTQVARVAQRPGWTADSARAVVAQQASRPERRALADAVIHNDGISLVQLQQEVRALWSLWTARSNPGPR
ncbi:MAG: dephospho-CoA kinase, partial [Rubrivivax sp.]|nr:dephospho-CoA kinase [Rubrivivax sp.]